MHHLSEEKFIKFVQRSDEQKNMYMFIKLKQYFKQFIHYEAFSIDFFASIRLS